MRSVSRCGKPESLRKNAAKWKRELIAALESDPLDRSLVNRRRNRYRHKDVRNALDEMYKGLCCYCEAQIGVVAFDHIEHRMPKSIFPELTFEWTNLHLACPKCNQAKGDKWGEQAPILDATALDAANRVEVHLAYRFRDVLGCIRSALTSCGETTIKDADLNREKLRNARNSLVNQILDLIGSLNRAPNSPERSELELELQAKVVGEFGSMVRWLINTYSKAA